MLLCIGIGAMNSLAGRRYVAYVVLTIRVLLDVLVYAAMSGVRTIWAS